MSERTVVQMFEDSVRTHAANVMMREKRGDKFQDATYWDIHQHVRRFAAGLMSYGIEKGDRIALISEGRNDWVIAELGILYTGAINVPMSVKINELSDLKFRLSHSGCRLVVVSANQAEKVFSIKNDLPDLEKIILLDEVESETDDILFLQQVLEWGDDYLTQRADEFKQRYESVTENDAANICYTSGTTADPKGIILTHRNYTANVEQASALLPIPVHYHSLLILPWDHSFAHTAGIYTLMNNGASMSSIQVGKTPMETLKNIPLNIKETRPTFLLSVPSLAQNFRKNIEKAIRKKGKVTEWLFRTALKCAYRYNGIGWNRGRGLRFVNKPFYALYDKILFSKIRENFGGKLEFFIGGGALLDIELQRFFYAIGIPMFQGYGLTEAAPIISANVPKLHKLGSSGAIVKDLQVKMCDDAGNEQPVGQKGEIVVKGENVMAGYWKNDKATRETIRDGWLYTGDLGYKDKDGFLYVLGREKSLLISNDGEKYSPEGIEEALISHSPYIDQMMLYNDQCPYTVALIVPNKTAVLNTLEEQGLDVHTESGQTAALKLFEKSINELRDGKVKDEFPSKWLPASFAILGEGFTEQNRFLNSTMKMVRGRITEYYQSRLDAMYNPEGKDVYNHQNKTIVSRFKE
ncbi:MAG: AMP-binding protein [candidate division KSB1 bacterium]|nr:AMP-binding protein [candidate division KSB1 bacterium]